MQNALPCLTFTDWFGIRTKNVIFPNLWFHRWAMQICLCFFSGWGQPDGDSQLANSDLELVDEQILCFGVGGLSLWLCSFLLSLCLRFASLLLFGLRLLSLGFLCSLPFVCSLSLPVAWSLCLLSCCSQQPLAVWYNRCLLPKAPFQDSRWDFGYWLSRLQIERCLRYKNGLPESNYGTDLHIINLQSVPIRLLEWWQFSENLVVCSQQGQLRTLMPPWCRTLGRSIFGSLLDKSETGGWCQAAWPNVGSLQWKGKLHYICFHTRIYIYMYNT